MANFKILLARPRGFCAGVERAITIVERALAKYGAPVYVRHEIVHNKRVVETLKKAGAIFVEELHEVPDGAVTIFSAHGVPEKVELEASRRELPVIDATCPLVTKVHLEGQRHAKQGREVVLIGHSGHPEVVGTQGRVPGGVHLVIDPDDIEALDVKDPTKLAYVTQTTLSVDETEGVIGAIKDRFPEVEGPNTKDICYATQNRQRAVRELAHKVDLVLVVGAKNSSNSNRLREIAAEEGGRAFLLDDAEGFDVDWLDGVSTVGITAGASAPEELVDELIARLQDLGASELIQLPGVEEGTTFKLPSELADVAAE